MNDLEIRLNCGLAAGLDVDSDDNSVFFYVGDHEYEDGSRLSVPYNPLENDAQAMALLRAWPMPTTAAIREGIMTHTGRWETFDVNRAICECVAKMQAAKQEGE